MTASISVQIDRALVVRLVVGLISLCGCSSGASKPFGGQAGSTNVTGGGGAGGSTAGAAGQSSTDAASTAGSDGGVAGSSPAGATGAAGQSTVGDEGTAGSGGTGGAAGSAGGAAGQSTAGAGGAGTTVDLTKVRPTAGCGLDAADFTAGVLVRQTIATSGTKAVYCADKKCGAWSFPREYFVQLPTVYDKNKAYSLLIEGPGCGGKGNNLYPMLPELAAAVIRVGLSPSVDASPIHATNPNQGCFDDKDGDNSIEWPFYEALWDKLAATLCFDRNRVFAGGNSSGAWLANELGCKYAGDATRPVRAVLPNLGGLPTQAQYKPTCTTTPMAGAWVFGTGSPDQVNYDIYAMNRALTANGCTPSGLTYQTASFDPFPISATDSTSCKKFKGCPTVAPLVVCSLSISDYSAHEMVVIPTWATFIKLFSTPPLLTP